MLQVSSSPDSAVFDAFFAGYDRAFILPDEKEDQAGFRACLALNAEAAYARTAAGFGPFREVVLTAHEENTGALIGGANFVSFPLPSRIDGFKETLLSTNLNYIYIDSQARRRGHFRRLVGALDDAARLLFESEAGRTPALAHLIFFELNDPFRLSPDSYERDTRHSGLDQFARVAIWAKLGARILDFSYVQPALSADQNPDEGLAYGLLGTSGAALSSCVLHDHLERFFGISVFKGKSPLHDLAARAQLDGLRERCAQRAPIALLDPKTCPSQPDNRFSSLRECLRASRA
ncbi:MAG TPA: hypothetical protein VGM72_09265 [Micropepsaceae bacterium]